MILHGKHLIKAWTKQQRIVATSTAEAELYAGNRVVVESMGVQAFARKTCPDSAAHRLQHGTIYNKQNRVGQSEAHRDSASHVGEDPNDTNSSDLGTKHLKSERSEMLLRLVNCFFV